jgi:hypothetical protein
MIFLAILSKESLNLFKVYFYCPWGYVFIDPEDGYFMAVKLKANGDIGKYIIGSSKTE